jgi:protein-S-isoprenylcysteine O-methyltransferase Ste14
MKPAGGAIAGRLSNISGRSVNVACRALPCEYPSGGAAYLPAWPPGAVRTRRTYRPTCEQESVSRKADSAAPSQQRLIAGEVTMGFIAGLYGAACYAVFLGSFLYAIGFVGDWIVPKTIDSGAVLGGTLSSAILIDVLLLGAFAIQHSVMARPGFKALWTRIVPRSVERSTYVLLSSLLLALICWQWRPLPAPVWNAAAPAPHALLVALSVLGWLIVLLSTFMINHFDLFGLRQVYLRMRGREYTPPHFVQRALYRIVRHPIMLGFIIAFWATPRMSVGHLLFAAATTGYILIGLQFEERDLMRSHGAEYRAYRSRVPMLLPTGVRRHGGTLDARHDGLTDTELRG